MPHANALTTVTLIGSATDPDGTVATLLWTQMSGPPPVTFTGTDTLSATVTLPDVNQPLDLVFRLAATDNEGKVGFADVTVSVDPVATQLKFFHVPTQANPPTASGAPSSFKSTTPRVRRSSAATPPSSTSA